MGGDKAAAVGERMLRRAERVKVGDAGTVPFTLWRV